MSLEELEKILFCAVNFVCQKIYQTKITKIVINFICQLLIKVLKIHKKIDKYFFLLEEIPHDLTNHFFLIKTNISDIISVGKNHCMDLLNNKA